jgi:hypothetical protein
MQIRKKGEEIKKKSPLKLLSQIFSNGGHLGYRTVLTDTILKGDHLRIISARDFFMNFELLTILTDYAN